MFRHNILSLKVIAYSSVGGVKTECTKMLTHNIAKLSLNPKTIQIMISFRRNFQDIE